MTDFMAAWAVAERDFPQEGTPAEKLVFCVRYAVLAPSIYNTQPWFFKIEDSVVSVYADRRYALPVIDPADRQLTICCGAALFNLRLAIRHFGYNETTELLPDPDDDDLLARVKLGNKEAGSNNSNNNGSRSNSTCDEDALFKAIPKRHTNCAPFADREIPEDVLQSLKSVASRENGWFHVCNGMERKTIIRTVAEADHIQTGNKNFRRELAAWLDHRRILSGDGMPALGTGYKNMVEELTPSVVRRFAVENQVSANDQQLDEGSQVIAVLGSKTGGILAHLQTGQALMHVMLLAEREGLSMSFLNQPCEVPELRLILRDEIDHPGRAQMIMRLGYGGKPSYTPRRPLSAVLEFEGRKAAHAEKAVANDGGKKKRVMSRIRKLFVAK